MFVVLIREETRKEEVTVNVTVHPSLSPWCIFGTNVRIYNGTYGHCETFAVEIEYDVLLRQILSYISRRTATTDKVMLHTKTRYSSCVLWVLSFEPRSSGRRLRFLRSGSTAGVMGTSRQLATSSTSIP